MDERLSSEALAQQVFSQALSNRAMAELPDFGSGEFWIDSRFSYGNLAQFSQDFHEHFKGNMGFFEKGIVVYWRGYSQSAFRAAQQAGIRLMSGWEVFKELEKQGIKENFLRNAAGKLAMFHRFA